MKKSVSSSVRTVRSVDGKRVLVVFFAVPIIPDFTIGAKRKSDRHRSLRNRSDTSRKPEVIVDRERSEASRVSGIIEGRYLVRSKGGGRIILSALKLFPVSPKKAIWNEEVVSVHIDVIHIREYGSRETREKMSREGNRIPRKDRFPHNRV